MDHCTAGAVHPERPIHRPARARCAWRLLEHSRQPKIPQADDGQPMTDPKWVALGNPGYRLVNGRPAGRFCIFERCTE